MMMNGRKSIHVITSTRADYGILRPLLLALQAEPDISLLLLVTGTHLSVAHGLTVAEIAMDRQLLRLELPILDSATTTPVQASTALMTGLDEVWSKQKPDLLFILGDRYEMLAAATVATLHNIPIAHLHGGELTLGAQDEVFRHAITKMSHLHFTSTEIYRQRVIQMGEMPGQVHAVGALALDTICQFNPLSREALAQACQAPLISPFYLVTYHPLTRSRDDALNEVDILASCLLDQKKYVALITGANADQGGEAINRRWQDWQQRFPDRIFFRMSLGQQRYFSAMHHAAGVIGNSSSGILEAPSFHVGTLNIGDRQLGREKAASVLQSPMEQAEIAAGFLTLQSEPFQASLEHVTNPYGDGQATRRILDVLRRQEWPLSVRKAFHDVR